VSEILRPYPEIDTPALIVRRSSAWDGRGFRSKPSPLKTMPPLSDTSRLRKFIGGEPIKPATNLLAG
jgi:hypothetical protein